MRRVPGASASTKPVPTIRRLAAADAETYRAPRLEGLRNHPEAFGASWEEETGRPPAWFAERLESNAVWGGWLGGDPVLAGEVEEVRLAVVASNTAAVRLYARLGFRRYGLEPRALRVGDRYHDELLMALRLRGPG